MMLGDPVEWEPPVPREFGDSKFKATHMIRLETCIPPQIMGSDCPSKQYYTENLIKLQCEGADPDSQARKAWSNLVESAKKSDMIILKFASVYRYSEIENGPPALLATTVR